VKKAPHESAENSSEFVSFAKEKAGGKKVRRTIAQAFPPHSLLLQ
jgi:hypothetical protein